MSYTWQIQKWNPALVHRRYKFSPKGPWLNLPKRNPRRSLANFLGRVETAGRYLNLWPRPCGNSWRNPENNTNNHQWERYAICIIWRDYNALIKYQLYMIIRYVLYACLDCLFDRYPDSKIPSRMDYWNVRQCYLIEIQLLGNKLLDPIAD